MRACISSLPILMDESLSPSSRLASTYNIAHGLEDHNQQRAAVRSEHVETYSETKEELDEAKLLRRARRKEKADRRLAKEGSYLARLDLGGDGGITQQPPPAPITCFRAAAEDFAEDFEDQCVIYP